MPKSDQLPIAGWRNIGDIPTHLGIYQQIRIVDDIPRKARMNAPGALHYIIVRGLERKAIFKEDIFNLPLFLPAQFCDHFN